MAIQSEWRNIYQSARITAGLTQERWSEVLGISAGAVRQYESGEILPSDEVVIRMAEVTGQHIICYWHLIQKSRVAAQILPDLERKDLPEAVLQLLVQVTEFQEHGLRELTRIAADGKVSAEERQDFDMALAQLGDLISSAFCIKYANVKEG